MEPTPFVPIEPAARENLIRLANAWCAATGNDLTSAGRYAYGDHRLFVNLTKRHKDWVKQGKPSRAESDTKGSISLRLHDKVVAWFFDLSHWPAGTTYDNLPELADISYKPKGNRHAKITKATETARPEQGQSASAALARLRQR